MEHPATEWLRARLSKGPSDAQDVADEAAVLEVTPEELLAARVALRVVQEGDKWCLPPPSGTGKKYDPRRLVLDSLVGPGVAGVSKYEPVRADLVPSKRATPKEAVEKAKNRLRKGAPRYAQYLDDLARKASEDAAPCPTCGRGTPRSEEVRLRAVLGALDRSGVVAPRGEGEDGTPSGPVIVFPPGTTIGVVVKTPEFTPVNALRVTRGDELGA